MTDKLDWFANVRISSLQKKTISVSNSVEKSLYSTSDLICIIVRCISDLWYNYTVFTMLKRRVFRISFQISNDVVHTTRNLYTVAIVKALTNIIVKYYIINFFWHSFFYLLSEIELTTRLANPIHARGTHFKCNWI